MKKILLSAFIIFSLSLPSAMAQNLDRQAESETYQMADAIKMNKKVFRQMQELNRDRLEKIAALATLREQDHRYLDLRLDEIEEQYAAAVFNTLNKDQFKAFTNYRREQPFKYASLKMKYNMIAQTEE